MDQEQDLDLLDLEDESSSVDALPEAAPFTAPRPKKPWLLMGLGVAIIVLATWIIIARVGGDSANVVNIDLNNPSQNVDNVPAPVADLNVPPKPVEVMPEPKPMPKPEVKPTPVPVAEVPAESNGMPVRVISDRKEVTFNPDRGETKTVSKPVVKSVAKPAAKPAAKPVIKPAAKAAAKPATTKPTATASNGSIYVQFGSYGTRAAAESAERKLRASHGNLFAGKQFVILAAQVNGQTKYRLRVAFQNSNEANGFCRNAKSDGLDCYVTK